MRTSTTATTTARRTSLSVTTPSILPLSVSLSAVTLVATSAIVAVVASSVSVVVGGVGIVVPVSALLLLCIESLHLWDQLLWQSEILDVFALDEDLAKLSEGLAVRTRLDRILQRHIHPAVSFNENSVDSLARLELNKKRLSLCVREQVYWKLELSVGEHLRILVTHHCVDWTIKM